MKRIAIALFSILLLTSCSIIDISKEKPMNIINDTLEKEISLYNNVFEGYKFYAPRGLKVIDKNKYNCKILSNDSTFYLYVDVISYYYKIKKQYVIEKDKVLSSEVKYDGKFGYVEVTEVKDKYFVEFMYNYSKIEAYIPKKDLNLSLLNMTYILSTMNYNDKVIETLIDEDKLDFKEEKIDIFESKSKKDNFLEALKKYDTYVEKEPDDKDVLDFEGIE